MSSRIKLPRVLALKPIVLLKVVLAMRADRASSRSVSASLTEFDLLSRVGLGPCSVLIALNWQSLGLEGYCVAGGGTSYLFERKIVHARIVT